VPKIKNVSLAANTKKTAVLIHHILNLLTGYAFKNMRPH